MIRSDNLIPLNSGAYQARSKIADAQICENLFPEINPQETDAPTPVTHYPREGQRPLSAPPVVGQGRGVFSTSKGALYAVAGSSVYFIDQNWNWTLLGSISNLSTPVSMSDNGTTAVIVDGTPLGYQITLATNVFSQIQDATGTFVGATRVDFADTFFAFNAPGTNGWYTSLSNQVAFNALAQGNKDSQPDPIATLAFNIRQVWLIGTKSSEVWYDAGGAILAYSSWPNVLIPYGTAAPYSLAQADVDLFWISRNPQGEVIAVQTKGLGVQAISTRALEYEWSNYPTVADCVAGAFQIGGHTFVNFHFPSADKTWTYDLATKQWHQRIYTDNNGVPHRDRVSFYASVGPDGGYPATIIGQDWQTGQIYALDQKFYTDNGQPIVCRRTFPHVMKDMQMITHVSFVADFESGGGSGNLASPGNAQAAGPVLCLRYSNDGGSNWSNYRQKNTGSTGNYRALLRWRSLGMARDRVYEVMWAYDGPTTLQGAYLEPIEHGS